MPDDMQKAINKLREIKEKNLLGGGLRQVERQHGRGKLTARERVDCLVDPGTFNEIGSAVNTTGIRMDGRVTDAPCDGAVVGTARIDGRTVAVYASDFTVLGGSLGIQHVQKCAELIKMAAGWGIPMIWLMDSSGGRLGYIDIMMAGIDWYFYLISRYSGLIPQINVLMGPCIAGQAYAPVLCDFLLMSRQTANLWLAGPRQAETATSEKIDESIGNADYHMAYSGTCDVVGQDDRETIAKARQLFSYLPSNFRERPPRKPDGDSAKRSVPEITYIVPSDTSLNYDMHRVIKILVDGGEYYEIKAGYAKNLITCFSRMNGEVVGIVANNPAQPGSVLEINACDKYYRFLQALDAYNIPLVTLVDTPDHLPGESEEKKGLLRHYGKILDVFATATIPKISVVLRRCAFDAGGMIMGGAKGMGVDQCFAWPISVFAVEASTLDYRGHTRGIEQDAYQGYLGRSRQKADAFETARGYTTQIIDEIIEPCETRARIIDALEITRNKKGHLPQKAKKHGTCPT